MSPTKQRPATISFSGAQRTSSPVLRILSKWGDSGYLSSFKELKDVGVWRETTV
jgi:hypothetical protein